MYVIFIIFKNNKTYHLHRLLLKLSNKKKKIIKGSDKYVPLSNLSIYCTWNNIKNMKI